MKKFLFVSYNDNQPDIEVVANNRVEVKQLLKREFGLQHEPDFMDGDIISEDSPIYQFFKQ